MQLTLKSTDTGERQKMYSWMKVFEKNAGSNSVVHIQFKYIFIASQYQSWQTLNFIKDLKFYLAHNIGNNCIWTRVSVQGVESLWGDYRFIPADWGS